MVKCASGAQIEMCLPESERFRCGMGAAQSLVDT